MRQEEKSHDQDAIARALRNIRRFATEMSRDASRRDRVALDFALETTKQFLALSTGVIAISVTFTKDLVADSGLAHKGWLICSWSTLLLSVVFGMLTMMALTGVLADHGSGGEADENHETTAKDGVYSTNVRILAGFQAAAFLWGMISLVVFAAKAY